MRSAENAEGNGALALSRLLIGQVASGTGLSGQP